MNEKLNGLPKKEESLKQVEFSKCPVVEDKTREELKEEEWQLDYSWHQNNWDHVEEVAERVQQGQKTGDWEYIRIPGFTEEEKKDNVYYLFKRKSPQRKLWEEQHGYD